MLTAHLCAEGREGGEGQDDHRGEDEEGGEQGDHPGCQAGVGLVKQVPQHPLVLPTPASEVLVLLLPVRVPGLLELHNLLTDFNIQYSTFPSGPDCCLNIQVLLHTASLQVQAGNAPEF